MIRANFSTAMGQPGRILAGSRPSLIVVQRSSASVNSPNAAGTPVTAKTIPMGHRIVQTVGGKPVVIVTKPLMTNSTMITTVTTPQGALTTSNSSGAPFAFVKSQGGVNILGSTLHPGGTGLVRQTIMNTAAPTATTTTAVTGNDKGAVVSEAGDAKVPASGVPVTLQPQNQTNMSPAKGKSGNVIVLDLSQNDQANKAKKSNVLSDILQATGIAADSSKRNDSEESRSSPNAQVQDEVLGTAANSQTVVSGQASSEGNGTATELSGKQFPELLPSNSLAKSVASIANSGAENPPFVSKVETVKVPAVKIDLNSVIERELNSSPSKSSERKSK